MRHPVTVTQPDDNSQQQVLDGYVSRSPRNPDFPQTVFRNERQVQRHHRDSGHEEYEDAARSMASHPLFRGLLQELPPRTAPPSQEWLDRWSATARSILELLYSRDPHS